ncbi:MAG: hypothetical protein C0507_04270 [Cyanobacteria bacterium PR.3.49]|nr:hypothetical protein [Cyanobacteria bacterium PR.3.49]
MTDWNAYEGIAPAADARVFKDQAHEARTTLSNIFAESTLDQVRQGSLERSQFGNEIQVRAGESIQRAIDSAQPGTIINLAEGVYREKLDIKRDGITIRGNGKAVIDMGDKPLNGPVINISGRKDITIDGLEIRNVRGGDTPMAIRVDGASRNIKIINNDIHAIKSNKNAHGIAVFGTSAQPLRDVLIQNNRVHDLKLGQSEAVVLNGNVEDFKIIGNKIYDNDNIGIDIIGGEGIGRKGIDSARKGLIANNLVANIDTRKNPTYNRMSAAGIYVDGGRDITIRDNVVKNSNYGIELASERKGWATKDIKVHGNRIENSHLAAISLGGGSAGNGGVRDSRVENNTLIGNKRIWKQHNVHNVR